MVLGLGRVRLDGKDEIIWISRGVYLGIYVRESRVVRRTYI